MKNGRENRKQWQPRKRQKRKRSTKQVQYEVNRGRKLRPLSFCGADLEISEFQGFKENIRLASSLLRTSLNQSWNALLLLRAETPISAEVAMNPRLGVKHPFGDPLRCFLHARARSKEFRLRPHRDHRNVLFQVVKG